MCSQKIRPTYLCFMSSHAKRLNKFIAESGYCSRRQADSYIENGQVKINSRKAVIGDLVYPGNRVMVNGFALDPMEESNLIFIALNKPTGVTSTTEASISDNIVHFVNHPHRIFPIGRLDKDSQGLIFLTNDGDVVNKILRAGNRHEKEYEVTVDAPLTSEAIRVMSSGVPMLGLVTKKCKITQLGISTFKVVLIQGLNRQIRRMCEHVGLNVIKLERTRIMHISLDKLALGDWRDLSPSELEKLYASLEDSQSVAPAKKSKVTSSAKPKIEGSTGGLKEVKSQRPHRTGKVSFKNKSKNFSRPIKGVTKSKGSRKRH